MLTIIVCIIWESSRVLMNQHYLEQTRIVIGASLQTSERTSLILFNPFMLKLQCHIWRWITIFLFSIQQPSHSSSHFGVVVAVCTYLVVAYLKYQLRSTYSVYKIMQILGISVFTKTPINELLTKTQIKQNVKEQLNLFNFNEILTHH